MADIFKKEQVFQQSPRPLVQPTSPKKDQDFKIQPIPDKFIPQHDHNIVTSFSCVSKAGKQNGTHKTNQDCYILSRSLNEVKFQNLFAVCDGHGDNGRQISNVIREKFLKQFQQGLLKEFNKLNIQTDNNFTKIQRNNVTLDVIEKTVWKLQLGM